MALFDAYSGRRGLSQVLFSHFDSSGRRINPLPETVASDHFRQVGYFSIAWESGTSVSKYLSFIKVENKRVSLRGSAMGDLPNISCFLG
jgi:hypothetical protein